MLSFDKVKFSYPGGDTVLDEVSFTINEGERVGMIGANGAGKSTIMKSALGLVATEGRITVCGLEMNKANLAEIRKMLGYVLQDSDDQMFMPTVIEDMIFGPMNYGKTREEAEQIADRTLKLLHVEKLKNKHNHKISGGEKRMAAIATVLAMEPKLMLMDEPSAALDPHNRRMLINVLNDIPVTKLIATHDLDLVLETCDRVILVNDGKIVADGETYVILTDRKLLEDNNLELPFALAGIPKHHIFSK